MHILIFVMPIAYVRMLFTVLGSIVTQITFLVTQQ